MWQKYVTQKLWGRHIQYRKEENVKKIHGERGRGERRGERQLKQIYGERKHFKGSGEFTLPSSSPFLRLIYIPDLGSMMLPLLLSFLCLS